MVLRSSLYFKSAQIVIPYAIQLIVVDSVGMFLTIENAVVKENNERIKLSAVMKFQDSIFRFSYDSGSCFG